MILVDFRRAFFAIIITVLAMTRFTPVVRGEPSPDVTTRPAYEHFIIVPVRVHILTSNDVPDVDCKLKDSDIIRVFGKANGIWHKAGIHLGLESIIREPAVKRSTFTAAKEKGEQVPPPLYRILRPEGTRTFDGLHVYYIHEFAVNGIYMSEDFAFVKETAALRKVDGGIDEPIPRVTAHELGHAMGLEHRQDRTNLMASGTTGTLLNAAEVEIARGKASKVHGALLESEAWSAAEAAITTGRTERAMQILTWLGEVPGEKATVANRRLESLKPATRPTVAETPTFPATWPAVRK